ncbi:MAG: threonine/serine exporter family protein [Desulfovibrio sp.]|nr:threonine/serine exporter family protein [Desulfovibrio sp.]
MNRKKALNVAQPTAKEIVEFIRVFASTLLAAGSQTSRIDRTTARIARAYGFSLDLVIFSRHFMFSAYRSTSDGFVQQRYTTVASIVAGDFNFQRVTQLNALSWAIADNGLPLEDAWRRFHAICAQPGISIAIRCLFLAVANAALCGLFNGDSIAIGLVFFAVYICFWLEQGLMRVGLDIKITFFLCAFFSSLLVSIGYMLDWGTTPQTALASSVLFLIPGFPLLNATMDFWDGYILIGVSRLIHAAMLVVSIALGLSLTMSLLGVDKL